MTIFSSWFKSSAPSLKPASPKREGEVRTHSLILLRWFAVFGQLIAIGIVTFGFGYPIPLYGCLLLIGILAISNLFMAISTSQRNIMSNYHTARLLAFDMVQLTGLFYLTGGLENPFSLTILVPVSISATLLSRGATIMLTILALFCATFLAFYHYQLPWQGSLLDLHTGRISIIYLAGVWVALVTAILVMAVYLWSLTEEARHTSEALQQTENALAREQNMSALGGLAAAAAHELGSPLATISVVAKEMINDLPKDHPLYEDAILLHEQSLRCRDILSGLARQPEHIGGEAYESQMLSDLVAHAAEGHLPAHIHSEIHIDSRISGAEPQIRASAELLQGLGNFYSNAGQFAKESVRTELFWDDEIFHIKIKDDGPGFAPTVLERIGMPYISTRAGKNGHMGLGLFIAQTLIERVGGRLRIGNRLDKNGAEIAITFPQQMPPMS